MKSIYAITPSDVEFKRLIKEVERMLDFGVKVFQYREKNLSENLIMANAEKLLEMIKKNEGKLIINDDPKIAVEIGADGFHLGMEDYLSPKNLKFIKEHKETINSDYIKEAEIVYLEAYLVSSFKFLIMFSRSFLKKIPLDKAIVS